MSREKNQALSSERTLVKIWRSCSARQRIELTSCSLCKKTEVRKWYILPIPLRMAESNRSLSTSMGQQICALGLPQLLAQKRRGGWPEWHMIWENIQRLFSGVCGAVRSAWITPPPARQSAVSWDRSAPLLLWRGTTAACRRRRTGGSPGRAYFLRSHAKSRPGETGAL